MKRLTVLLLVCALAAFGLAACGDDDDDNGTTGATTGTTGTTGDDRSDRAARPARDGGGGGGTLKVAADPSGALKFTEDSLTAKRRQDEGRLRRTTRPYRTTLPFEQGDKEVGATEGRHERRTPATTVTL